MQTTPVLATLPNFFGIEQVLMFPLGTLKLNVKMNSRPIYLESNFAVLLMLETFFPSVCSRQIKTEN